MKHTEGGGDGETGYSTGRRVCELTAQCMGMSGTPLEMSHREGILLDVTMNRKPPPEPTQAFDVRGSHGAVTAPGGGGYIVTLNAWQPHGAMPGPTACSAQPEEEKHH